MKWYVHSGGMINLSNVRYIRRICHEHNKESMRFYFSENDYEDEEFNTIEERDTAYYELLKVLLHE